MPYQDVWKFTPVSYRTSALWGRCPALTPLLQLITPSRVLGTADHVRSLDDLFFFLSSFLPSFLSFFLSYFQLLFFPLLFFSSIDICPISDTSFTPLWESLRQNLFLILIRHVNERSIACSLHQFWHDRKHRTINAAVLPESTGSFGLKLLHHINNIKSYLIITTW